MKVEGGRISGLSDCQRGYTLYLVMIILSIAAILFSITIAEIRSVRLFAAKEVQKRQAKLLAESGIIRTECFLNGGDGHSIAWETPLYEEKPGDFDTIKLVVEQFGLFSRVISTGKHLATDYRVEGLFGRNVPQLLAPTLTLTGHVGGLILHRGSDVEGGIVFHHGYVYAKKKGNPLPDYTCRLTFRESPPLPFDTLQLPSMFEKYSQRRTSLLQNGPTVAGPLTLHGGNDSLLKRSTLVVNGDCRIMTPGCTGAVIAVSGTCTIECGAKVRLTACFADKIVCEDGATDGSLFFSEKTMSINGGIHNSQFLARDSIGVLGAAALGKMTVIAGLRQEFTKDSLTATGGGIRFDDHAALRGTIICCAATGVNRNAMSPSIVIGEKSAITGNIVTDGDCYIYECDITGHVWARSIVSRDADGSYTNYLIRSSIRCEREEVPFPLIGEVPLKIVFTPVR
ncbi:MAG: type II secretion system protein [Chitinispirillaceae bacterium]|nr:type II secretion system protein [Chitinispirillaceae bacterium]